jgi:serine palmitoyltransferase
MRLPSITESLLLVREFPALYKEWWLNLVRQDPVHVIVETTLLISIVYILVSRSKDWKELEKESLTDSEKEELLREWKATRAPLTPDEDDDLPRLDVVVHKQMGRELLVSWDESEATTVLNFATFDFLGLAQAPHVKEAALKALDRYGCGSCGPRGFYGTVDVHLKLEKAFADFCKSADSILYSDGASASTSTIAAFCKRGDLLVVDEAVYEPLVTGVHLSRAHVKWFKHNDMKDLRRVLEKVKANDKQLGRPTNAQRRFIITEALFKNTGSIVPLDELVKLKHEFSYRLILDETFSFGTLGRQGRGILELYNKKLMHDAEIVIIGLENSMGSVGGLTVGTEEVVDHQRLSGSGYCYSASSPPFTAVSAMAALDEMQNDPDIVEHLQENRAYLYTKLVEFCTASKGLLVVTSSELSPIAILQIGDTPEADFLDELVFMREVVRECLERGVALVATNPQTLRASARGEGPPGIRITASAVQQKEDIDTCIQVLGEAVDVIMKRFHEESA